MISAIYETAEPNTTIDLGEETVRLTIGNQTLTQEAAVRLKLLPRPRLQIEVQIDESPWILLENPGGQATFMDSDTKFEMFMVNATGPRVVFTPSRSPICMAAAADTGIDRVVFHLFNFPECFCVGDSKFDLSLNDEEGGMHRVGRLVLQAEEWNVEVTGSLMTKSLVSGLKETGGYAITHVGEIRRTNGADFSCADAEDVLARVHHFLSFARGQWVSPALAVGFDKGGRQVWKEWGVGKLDPWANTQGWFDVQHGEILSQVFPGFNKLYIDSVWSRALKECIYWYVRSNAGGSGAGPDGGLILTQAGLELLAWVYCVKDRHLLSEDGFRRLRASDRLRLLLASLRIPKDIPVHNLTEITKLAKHMNWMDGPQALTEVRNQLVHPSDKHQEMPYYESWTLAQWYLELIVLRLCDHVGEYGNRITQKWEGEVERVPWVS